jgi:hypothetical protein
LSTSRIRQQRFWAGASVLLNLNRQRRQRWRPKWPDLDQARTARDSALSAAAWSGLNSRLFALYFAANLRVRCGEYSLALQEGEAIYALSTDHNFSFFLGCSAMFWEIAKRISAMMKSRGVWRRNRVIPDHESQMGSSLLAMAPCDNSRSAR